MYYIISCIDAFIFGVVICKNIYCKNSILSDLDVMYITQHIESYVDDNMYNSLKSDWEYVLRTHEQNIDNIPTNLRKIIEHVLTLD